MRFFVLQLGVVQIVECLLWEQEVAGAEPATQTKITFFFYIALSSNSRIPGFELGDVGAEPTGATLSGHRADGYTRLVWDQDSEMINAGSNPAAQTFFSSLTYCALV